MKSRIRIKEEKLRKMKEEREANKRNKSRLFSLPTINFGNMLGRNSSLEKQTQASRRGSVVADQPNESQFATPQAVMIAATRIQNKEAKRQKEKEKE